MKLRFLYCHARRLVFIALQSCSYVLDKSNLSEYIVSHEEKQSKHCMPSSALFFGGGKASAQYAVTEMLIYHMELVCLLFEWCLAVVLEK